MTSVRHVMVEDGVGLHSVRTDIWQALKSQRDNRTEGAHRRFAAVREALDEADTHLTRLFERYESAQADMDAQGVVAQMKLSPVLEAAYREFQHRASENPAPRVFVEVPDPPIGPELD